MSRPCGVAHPALIGADRIELLTGQMSSRTGSEVFGYAPGWGAYGADLHRATEAMMRAIIEGQPGQRGA